MDIRDAMKELSALRELSVGRVLLIGTHVWKGRLRAGLERHLFSGVEVENVKQVDGSRLILPFPGSDGKPMRASAINEATGFGADLLGSVVQWQSIAIDFDSPTATSLLRRLGRLRHLDGVASNLHPKLLDRFGLGHVDLQAIDRRIFSIHGSYEGADERGEFRLGLHHTAAAECGHTVMGMKNGVPNLGGPSYIDHMSAARAVSMALVFKIIADKTGRGLKGEVTLKDIAVELLGYQATFLWTERLRKLFGEHLPFPEPYDRHLLVPTFGAFPTKPVPEGDERRRYASVVIGAVTAAASKKLGATLGAKGVEEHCADSWDMFRHRNEICAAIAERTAEMTTEEVLALVATGKDAIPAAAHRHIVDVFDDPQLHRRHMIGAVMSSDGEAMYVPGFAGLNFDPKPALKHGEHTRQVLREIGVPDGDIATLVKEKVIYCAD